MPGPTVSELVTGWQVDPAALLVAAVVGGLYALGVRRLAARGHRWSRARSAAMAGTVVTGLVATQSGVGRYEYDAFWVHMTQHLLLGLVAPILLVLAAPLTLALQSAGPLTRQTLRRALRSPAAHLLAHPLVAWSLFGGGLAVLYLTPLLDLSARHEAVHLAVHAHIVASSALFCAMLVGVDPLPGRPPFAGRLLALLVALPFHAVVGLGLVAGNRLVAPDAYPELADQRLAGGLFWVTGELFTVGLAAVVVRQWWVAEKRAEAREALAEVRAASHAGGVS